MNPRRVNAELHIRPANKQALRQRVALELPYQLRPPEPRHRVRLREPFGVRGIEVAAGGPPQVLLEGAVENDRGEPRAVRLGRVVVASQEEMRVLPNDTSKKSIFERARVK